MINNAISNVTAPQHTSSRQWPADVADLLGRAAQLLEAGAALKALDLLSRADGGPWVVNARGVCLLRLGDAERALEVFRGLALGTAGFGLKEDAPTVFKTNYATAQLLSGKMTACVVTLSQTRDEGHPAVQRVRAAIRRWERSLSFWERICYYMGSGMDRLVVVDAPGDL